jgi:hypothetical protein
MDAVLDPGPGGERGRNRRTELGSSLRQNRSLRVIVARERLSAAEPERLTLGQPPLDVRLRRGVDRNGSGLVALPCFTRTVPVSRSQSDGRRANAFETRSPAPNMIATDPA